MAAAAVGGVCFMGLLCIVFGAFNIEINIGGRRAKKTKRLLGSSPAAPKKRARREKPRTAV